MESLLTLRNRVAFITGSTRGIGWATAEIFARHGATVLINGCSDRGALDTRVTLLREKYGVHAEGFFFDASSPTAIQECYSSIFKNYKRLDILVNNAGIMDDRLIGMITPDNVQRVLDVNIKGPILNLQCAARLMRKSAAGSIVNISSIMGRLGNSGQAVYASSKAAIIGLTRSAAKELASQNIRVNAVAPGFIDTNLTEELKPEVRQERLKSIKLGRAGTAEEVAKTVLFLATDLSSYVTGQVLGVDGAMVI